MATRQRAENALTSLFRRCVECPSIQPSCPQCATDETCTLVPPSCNDCASMVCLKISSLPGQAAPKSSTPVGPIVGGVIGGVLAIIFGVFCVWFFCIKNKRRKDTWSPPEKREQSDFTRAGGRTQSIASTVLSRASNVIQIAYIPGVTGRSPPESPAMPPPMPSIPHGYASSTTDTSAMTTPQPEQHFFMPRDLRDSTWSDTSSVDPRISLAPSLARASVATTIYRNDAIVPPVPAQHAFRAQANMVSVKSSSIPNTPGMHTPPIPQTSKITGINGSSIVARNVTARPIEVKKAAVSSRVPTLANLAKANSPKKTIPLSGRSTPAYYDEKEVVVSRVASDDESLSSSLVRSQPSYSSMDTASASGVSATMSAERPTGSGPTHRHTNSSDITAMIEQAINRAAQDTTRSVRPGLHKHDSGPFSDANELKEG